MIEISIGLKPSSGATGVLRENPQGGGVFIHCFESRLAEIKTPPPSVFFFFPQNIKLRISSQAEGNNKRNKLKHTITSMFSGDSPKFVEASGIQLLCPYCHHKFRAPQG